MSANTPSTSGASGPPKSTLKPASRVFVLTPEMLKKMGLADQLKLIQSKIKKENTVKLVANVQKPVIKPKMVIPSDKVRIIKKKDDKKVEDEKGKTEKLVKIPDKGRGRKFIRKEEKSPGENENHGSGENNQQLNFESTEKEEIIEEIYQIIDVPNSESPNEMMRDKSSLQEDLTSQNNILEDSEMTDLVKNRLRVLEERVSSEKLENSGVEKLEVVSSVEDHIESELNKMNLIQSPPESIPGEGNCDYCCGKDEVTEAADELMKILEETGDEFDPVDESISRSLSEVIMGDSGGSGAGETRGDDGLSTVESGRSEGISEIVRDVLESSENGVKGGEEISGEVKALGDAPQVESYELVEIEVKKLGEVSVELETPVKTPVNEIIEIEMEKSVESSQMLKTPVKTSVRTSVETSVMTPVKTPVKAPVKSPVKTPVNEIMEIEMEKSVESSKMLKTPVKTPVKAPVKSPVNTPVNEIMEIEMEKSVESSKILKTPVKTPVNEIMEIKMENSVESSKMLKIPVKTPVNEILEIEMEKSVKSSQMLTTPVMTPVMTPVSSPVKTPVNTPVNKLMQSHIKKSPVFILQAQNKQINPSNSQIHEKSVKMRNIRPLKPKPNISRQLPRGVMKNNKLETSISGQNDQLSSTNTKISPSKAETSPKSSVIVNSLKNFKIPKKNNFTRESSPKVKQKPDDQVSNHQLSPPKSLNNFDVLMEAVDINLKQENAEKNNRLSLPDTIGSLDESSVMNNQSSGTLKSLEPPEKIEDSKIIDNSRTNVKSKRKRTSKLDLVQTIPAKVPKPSTPDREVLEIKTGQKDSSSLVKVPEATPRSIRSSRRQSKPKIFQDCIMWPSRTPRPSQYREDMMVNSLISKKSTTRAKSIASSTEDDSPRKLIIDESRSESSEVEDFDIESKLVINRTINGSSKPPVSRNLQEEGIIKSLISQKSSVTLKSLEETVSQSFKLKKEINEGFQPLPEVEVPGTSSSSSSGTESKVKEEVEDSKSGEISHQIPVESSGEPKLPKNPEKSSAIKPRKVFSSKVIKRRTSLREKPQINESMETVEVQPVIETSRRRSQTSRKTNEDDNVPSKIKNSRRKSRGSKVVEEDPIEDLEIDKTEDLESGENIPEEILPTPEPLNVIASSPAKSEENPVETPPEDISRIESPDAGKPKEIPEIIASLEKIPAPVGKRRGRPRRQPPVPSEPQPDEEKDPIPPADPSIPLGRRRREKASEEPNDLEEHDDKSEDKEEIDTHRPRKPSNRPDETDGKGLSESSSEESSLPDDPPARRGRSRRGRGRVRGRGRAPIDREYTPRGPAAPKRPPPPSSLSEPKSKVAKCAKCQEEMPSSAWSRHNLSKHNDMSWKDGEPQPDFDDHRWLTSLLSKTKRKKSSLICECCGTSKKSVAGFISHITFCGKSEEEKQSLMWTCPLCKIILMPSSQEYHERQHRDQELGIVKKKIITLKPMIEGDNSRVKRKAAERAATKISEFTDLVKGAEEHPAKKRKMSARVLELIQPPQLSNRIPGIWKTMWTRAINHNEKAYCRQPGCDFSAPTLLGICDHYSQCNFTPRPSYLCKICDFSNLAKSDVFKHIKEQHWNEITGDDSDYNASGDDESEDDYVNADDEDGRPRGRRPGHQRPPSRPKAKFIIDAMSYRVTPRGMTFSSTLKWTAEFQNKYYRLYLFDDLKPNLFESVGDFEEYLPKLKVSMQTSLALPKRKAEAEEHDWKRWDRFEADVVGVVPTFFTGGPIWALAWLPIPPPLHNKKPDQYLAISSHPTMESTYEVGQCYSFKNSIQIWNIGPLAHDSAVPRSPELSYCLAHEEGTIWCLEWCPSGCYDHDTLRNVEGMKRMGLLAAAMSSGAVHIYSLPFPEDLCQSEDEINPKVLKTDPVMILRANSGGNSQCMTLTWSKTSDHDTIAAGYSNGYVAIWDLATKSTILRSKVGSTVHLNSFMHFYAHGHAVMFVSVIPIEGKRYLATAGMDRYSKMWDLEDVSKDFWCLKRGVGVNGTWMTHWPIMLTCYDDVLGLGHTQTYLASVREAAGKVMPMLPTNSPVFAIASSDWANGVCQGTLAGEVVAIFPPQMLYTKEIDKLTRRRWLVTNVEVVDFEGEKEIGRKEYDYKPEGYEECQERFGVAFYDDLDNTRGADWMNQHEKKGYLSAEVMASVPLEQYPFTAINRVSWNPNGWSHLWIAVGYRNGLVRVLNLRRMNKNSITVDMLSKHAASIRKKEEELKNS